MAGRNSVGLKKTPKSKCHGGSVASFEAIDRLSDLPDNLLHHILSFLDSKSLFRTSLLSRRWGCVWRAAPALNFSCDYFSSMSSFKEHVIKVLSLRSDDSAAVSSVNFKAWTSIGDQYVKGYYINLFDRVMEHAASIGPPRRSSLQYLSLSHPPGGFNFSLVELVASMKAHHHHQSLKTLHLKEWLLVQCADLFSGFNLLTNLELHDCFDGSALSSVVEPFVGLPSLKRLKLVGFDMVSPCLLKVSGPELLDLQIQHRDGSSSLNQKYQVFAPKLKSFCFRGCLEQLIQLDLPSLDHVDIRVRINGQRVTEATHRACMKLLSQLHNAESLNLCFDTTKSRRRWQQHEFPFISNTELFAELGGSPFIRLKTLRVWYPYAPPAVPYQVVRYFLEGSPHTVRKSFEFQKSQTEI